MSQQIELQSAPGETLTHHLELVLGEWKKVTHRFQATLPRLFGVPWNEVENAVKRMLLLHDLGKATMNWQPEKPGEWKDDDSYICPMCEKPEVIKPDKGQTPAQAFLTHVEKEHKHFEKTEEKDWGKWRREKARFNEVEKEILVVDGLKTQREEKRPPHAQLGGAYLWWVFGKGKEREPGYDLVMASAFAIAIHHTDNALARPGVEDPATLLVTSGLIDEIDDRIRWHEKLEGFVEWVSGYAGLENTPNPREMDVYAVSEFALELRAWARGASLLELHRRRLQVAALHSVIKVCDIRAAIARSGEPLIPVNTFTWTIINGGLLL